MWALSYLSGMILQLFPFLLCCWNIQKVLISLNSDTFSHFFLKLNLFTDTLNMLANIYILYSSEPFKSSSFSFFLIYLFIFFLFWGEGVSNAFVWKKNRLWFILKFYWLLWRKVNILNGSMLFSRLWVIYIYCNIS